MQSISLADELTLARRARGRAGRRGQCPGVPVRPQENLAAMALAEFRAATGWRAPPLLLRIGKRIPVAAGLGGGSADAAAALRLARHASGLGDEELLREGSARSWAPTCPRRSRRDAGSPRAPARCCSALPAPVRRARGARPARGGRAVDGGVYAEADGSGWLARTPS